LCKSAVTFSRNKRIDIDAAKSPAHHIPPGIPFLVIGDWCQPERDGVLGIKKDYLRPGQRICTSVILPVLLLIITADNFQFPGFFDILYQLFFN
jgi:hypothetical protein